MISDWLCCDCIPTALPRNHCDAEKRRFQSCYQTLAEYFSTTLRSGLGKPAGAAIGGFQIRDSAMSLRRFTTSTLHHFNHAMRSSTASANLFIFLASILSLSTASGQTAPRGALPGAARKIRDASRRPVDLPARDFAANDLAIWRVHQLSGERRREGNNIVGDAANEPSISVDPTDGNKVAIGWRQFDTHQSDFRQAGYGYTTDAGVTGISRHFAKPASFAAIR